MSSPPKKYTRTPSKQEFLNPYRSTDQSDFLTTKKTNYPSFSDNSPLKSVNIQSIEGEFWKSKWADLNDLYQLQQDKLKQSQQEADISNIHSIENSFLKKQLENANDTIEQLNEENLNLRTQLIRASGLKDQEDYNRLLEDKISSLNSQISKLNQQFREEALSNASLQRNYENALNQNETLKSLTDLQMAEITNLKSENDSLKMEQLSTSKQLRQLKSSNELATLESSTWQNRASSLEREKYELQIKNQQIQQLTIKNNRIEIERKVLTNKIDQQSQIINKLYGQLNDNGKQKQNLERSLVNIEVENSINRERAKSLEQSLSIERGRSQNIIQQRDIMIGDLSREKMRVERDKILKEAEARQKNIEAQIWKDQARTIEIQKNAQILSEQEMRNRQRVESEQSQYIQAQAYTHQLNNMNLLLNSRTLEVNQLRRNAPRIITLPHPTISMAPSIVYYQ